MNRILLATICGIILGAIIISMASSDRFVGADSLARSSTTNQEQARRPQDLLAPFPESRLDVTSQGASPVNPLAPRSGRDRVGTTRGRDRSGFESTQGSNMLIDRDALNAERAREAIIARERRHDEREDARRRAQQIMQARREQAMLERQRRNNQMAEIRARANATLASSVTTSQSSLNQNGVSDDVANAIEALAQSLSSQGQLPAGITARGEDSSSLIDSLVGAISAEMNQAGGPRSLASLLDSLGFGGILDSAGLSSLDLITMGQQGLPEFLIPDAPPKTVWVPVERSRNSRILSTTRTNDLYVVFGRPSMVTVVESPPDTGLQLSGGSFVQVDGGSNGPTTFNPNDERAYDSFLTVGGESPAFAGDDIPDSNDWGNAISATWFAVPPQPGEVNRSRFGDDRSYVWIGRFTVKGDTGATPVVNGRIRVSSLDLLSGETDSLYLGIEADPTLWSPVNELAPIEPRLKSFQTRTGFVRSGENLTLSLDLDLPSPRTGVEVSLSSDNPLVSLPEIVKIPYESIGLDITVTTGFTFDPVDVLLRAESEGVVFTKLVRLGGHARGDLSEDGYVDGADLGLLLGAWGMSDLPIADLNGDGTVDGADLGLLLGYWRAPEQVDVELGINSRWIPVSVSTTCAPSLENVRTADLYLGFDSEPANKRLIIDSPADTGLRVEGGTFYQDVYDPNFPATGNIPPLEGFLYLNPCLAYDSYVSVGSSSPLFTPGRTPDPDWGTQLEAQWFQVSEDDIILEQDPIKFGDNRYYMHIGRISASLASTFVGGTISVIDGATTHEVEVEHASSIWGDFDFDNDDLVDFQDATLLKDAVAAQSTDLAFDLDGDGLVDGDDLVLFLVAFPEYE